GRVEVIGGGGAVGALAVAGGRRPLRAAYRLLMRLASLADRAHPSGRRKAVENALVRRYLRRRRFDVVLAEFGPTGAALRGGCVEAGVPLVVHFHGFDAYAFPTLEAMRDEYPKLWRDAAAIVVGSRHMQEQLVSLGAPRGR